MNGESCADGKKISAFIAVSCFIASYKKQTFHPKQVCACADEGILSRIHGILDDIVVACFFLFNFMQHFEISKSSLVALLPT